jgi:hypothetical protein
MMVVVRVGVAACPGSEDIGAVNLIVVVEAGEPGCEQAGTLRAGLICVRVKVRVGGGRREPREESGKAPLKALPLEGVAGDDSAFLVLHRRLWYNSFRYVSSEATR